MAEIQRTKAVTTTQATSLTATLPSNVTTGNLLIALITTTTGSGGITMPGGWTQRASDTAMNANTFVYDHTTTGTSDKSLVLTLPAGGAAIYLIEVAGLTGFDVATTFDAGSASTAYTASITPTTANSYVLGFTSHDTTSGDTDSFSGSSGIAKRDGTDQTGSTSTTFQNAYGESTVTGTSSIAVTVTPSLSITGVELIALAYKGSTGGLAAPTNLHTTSVGSTTIGTAWNSVVNAVGYELVVALVGALTVPGVPTGVTAAAGNTQATVSWTAPSDNGGTAIIDYTVTSSPGGFTATTSGLSTAVTGLTNGTAYTFTVKARNSVGSSAASAASGSVTPTTGATVPGAPTTVSATAGDAQATVIFAAPASDGGSAIIDYTATSSPGSLTSTGAGSPRTVTSLTNNTSYTFTVKARNAIGSSAASGASNAVTPVASGAPSTPAGYSTLAFFDDFPGTTLDTTKWNTYYAERGSSQQREDWGNGQRQYYKDANVTVSGGYCHLKYVRENTTSPATGHTYDWSGGMIDSHSKFTYRQGYAEARIWIPCVGPGLWPAWWTWADTNDNTSGSGMGGELDMFEFYSDNHSSQYVTYQGGSSTTVSNADWTAGWHTYGTDWNGTNTRFYIDRSLVLTSSNASTYTGNMLLLVTAQVADDGSLTGTNRAPAPSGSTTSPQEMLVDYVAVWH